MIVQMKRVAQFQAAALALSCAWVVACGHEVDSPKISLDRVEPELICNAQFPEDGLSVLIHGDGFTPLPEKVLEEPAELELPQVVLTLAKNLDGSDGDESTIDFSGEKDGENADRLGWRTKQLMSLRFDEDLAPEPGLYGMTITNPDGKSKSEKEVALAVVEPPVITSIEPTALCNGFQDQQLNIHGENFIKYDDMQPTVEFTDEEGERFSFDVEGMDECEELEGLSVPIEICSLVSVIVPATELPQGQYELTVTNPEPANCTTEEPAEIEALGDGPILFFSDPPVVFDGINTKITLHMTAVSEPFEVKVVPTGELTPETELSASLVANKSNQIQATVPSGQGAGTYDIVVNDDTGCETRLEGGLTVTDELAIELDSIVPPFGHVDDSTAVTIFRSGGEEFAPTPRAFLNPVGADEEDVAIQLHSVTFVNADELNAIVPEGTPLGRYDLVVVNPSGEVGLLEDAYESIADPPPVVNDVVPQSIVNQADQTFEVRGTGFAGSDVSLRCKNSSGANVSASVSTADVNCADGSCTVTATADGSGLDVGTVCVVRVTNGNGSYGEFSAIGVSNSSFNLAEPRSGPDMTRPRRRLVAASVKATSASRFVYAIGGDDGAADPFRNVEVAPVNVFGDMSNFFVTGQRMASPRSAHAGTQIGRYIYVMGGTNGSDALSSAERALVLSPEESPVIEDLSLCLGGNPESPCFDDEDLEDGLSTGGYAYRVAAMIDPADPQNLGGETLASDPLIMKLPEIEGRAIVVKLTWSVPRDPAGDALSGIIGWRVYRTPVDGVPGKDEVLLAELNNADARSYIDDGSGELDMDTSPLPLGSTSAWQALPDLAVARQGLSAAAARDPSAADTWHVYALLGEGHTTYEHLTVTVLDNGRQTVGGSWTTGAEESAVARTEFGAWVVDDVVSDLLDPGETHIYLGAGLANGSQDDRVEAGVVTAGGELGAFEDDPTAQDDVGDFSSTRVGYGTAAAAGRLFVFGGLASTVRDNATAAELTNPPPSLANNAWNNEGLSMTTPRYRMGSSIQSAFIFLLGGQTDAGGSVTTSTEWVVW